ncbi:ferrochelatase [Stella humosa]|uniref:Ferrochelatase n=1 Tax=Stella humosa TaxID=94 RepID=A0A3N1LJB9_9PROT|nr:ferrochelatase [Stella humosa]ROP90958.1 ferrochelatase [Stella humosa]BBK34692.1 ferrochelatase [Stella humosa]
MARVAVVLFNLGGPDGPAAVKPFLVNLFSDPAIMRVPGVLRWLLARVIARRRALIAQANYDLIGGGSPLLPNTMAQADALTQALADLGTVRTFVAMRYWRPFAADAARAVADFKPDRVVLLPLYPQFSTTTTASSLADWKRAADRARITAPSTSICCYPLQHGLVAAEAELVAAAIAEACAAGPVRVLFSAHGLPEKIVAAGDPYQWQVEQTSAAVAARAGLADGEWVVCYQSRVGPLRWIGPSTEEEIARAGRDKVALVVVPIAFVSEHSETLVELDIEYRELAHKAGVPAYVRSPTVGSGDRFIDGLADLVRDAVARGPGWAPPGGQRLCPGAHGDCPIRAGAAS